MTKSVTCPDELGALASQVTGDYSQLAVQGRLAAHTAEPEEVSTASAITIRLKKINSVEKRKKKSLWSVSEAFFFLFFFSQIMCVRTSNYGRALCSQAICPPPANVISQGSLRGTRLRFGTDESSDFSSRWPCKIRSAQNLIPALKTHKGVLMGWNVSI